jgi:hypothetical protein
MRSSSASTTGQLMPPMTLPVTSTCGVFSTCGALPRSPPGSRVTTRNSRPPERERLRQCQSPTRSLTGQNELPRTGGDLPGRTERPGTEADARASGISVRQPHRDHGRCHRLSRRPTPDLPDQRPLRQARRVRRRGSSPTPHAKKAKKTKKRRNHGRRRPPALPSQPLRPQRPLLESTVASSPAATTPAGCSPLSNEGTCYEPGEYCRNSDHGISGIAGDGEAITCEDNDGWRWEPS